MSAKARLIVVGALAWSCGRRLLVQRRGPNAGHGAGHLELAGGKVEPGESPPQALSRELTEEWGSAAARLVVGPIADVLHHCYPPPGPEVLLLVYHVDARGFGDGAALRPVDGAQVLAIDADDPPAEEFLAADRPLLHAIAAGRVRCPF
jgi:8-oxo-dGTP diphosphatase